MGNILNHVNGNRVKMLLTESIQVRKFAPYDYYDVVLPD